MKNKLKLILPNKKYVRSLVKGLDELREEGNMQTKSLFGIFHSAKDFPVLIKKIRTGRKGLNLPKGIVPQTVYFGVVGNKFVGILKLRHKLNKNLLQKGGHIGYSVMPSERCKGYATEMLKLGLQKAKKLGIEKVLVTCLEKNIASRKVIERNGGILENKIKIDEGALLRFWIKN